MNTTKHIFAYVSAGLVALVFMLALSLFTSLPALNIGLGCLFTIWLPLYALITFKMTGVE